MRGLLPPAGGLLRLRDMRLEFEEAFEEQQAREPLAPRESAEWAFGWIVDNYKDMQEDTCRRFSND